MRRVERALTKMEYLERDQAILALCRGRTVLHLGCVGFTDCSFSDRVRQAKESLHWSLSQMARVTGIDSSAAVVREYQRLGAFNNIIVGDVERLDELEIADKFDVILIADIIEHLSNPGLMLEGIKNFCWPDTQIVVTTPHAFGLPNYLRFLTDRFHEGAEHVMTFNMHNVRNFLERHGYRIEEISTCWQVYAKQRGILFTLGRNFFSYFPKLGGTLFVVATPGWQIVEPREVAAHAVHNHRQCQA